MISEKNVVGGEGDAAVNIQKISELEILCSNCQNWKNDSKHFLSSWVRGNQVIQSMRIYIIDIVMLNLCYSNS